MPEGANCGSDGILGVGGDYFHGSCELWSWGISSAARWDGCEDDMTRMLSPWMRLVSMEEHVTSMVRKSNGSHTVVVVAHGNISGSTG